ncbi:MAG: hypothetical protein IID18_00435 [Nitrospinae bacterium]|nr:hypothetical protein [Nitrospinota bacterium]
MKNRALSGTGILIFLLTTGCAAGGQNFDISQSKTIQNNITTQTEILDKFGSPFKEGFHNGQVMWTYQFDQWNALGPAKSKDLVILFDENNIVRAYRYTSSEPK